MQTIEEQSHDVVESSQIAEALRWSEIECANEFVVVAERRLGGLEPLPHRRVPKGKRRLMVGREHQRLLCRPQGLFGFTGAQKTFRQTASDLNALRPAHDNALELRNGFAIAAKMRQGRGMAFPCQLIVRCRLERTLERLACPIGSLIEKQKPPLLHEQRGKVRVDLRGAVVTLKGSA